MPSRIASDLSGFSARQLRKNQQDRIDKADSREDKPVAAVDLDIAMYIDAG